MQSVFLHKWRPCPCRCWNLPVVIPGKVSTAAQEFKITFWALDFRNVWPITCRKFSYLYLWALTVGGVVKLVIVLLNLSLVTDFRLWVPYEGPFPRFFPNIYGCESLIYLSKISSILSCSIRPPSFWVSLATRVPYIHALCVFSTEIAAPAGCWPGVPRSGRNILPCRPSGPPFRH